jgi:phosphate acetyltransferase
MHKFLRAVHKKARQNPKKIVFPEGSEERILRACEDILDKGLAQVILIGASRSIKANAAKLELQIDWDKVEIHDPKRSKKLDEYAKLFFEKRKEKGITLKEARATVEGINYFGTMMVESGDADGMVTGTTYSTADSIRPALQIIKTKDRFQKVSGVFFLILENRVLLLADTAITIEPNSHDLKDIAIDTAETAHSFGMKPRVAFLSFSTKGSADHPEVDKVKEAVAMMKAERPEIICDGEIQVDTALVPKVAAIKAPKSAIQGDANVLIFPNLAAANIAYKLVERLAKAKAIGPILQGLNKPVNDLSRGCSYQDIVNITAFTVCECQNS